MTIALSSPERPRGLAAIQVLRCLAAVLVVVFHSELAIRGFDNHYWAPGDDLFRAAHYPFWANHLSAGVDIFFCISGFIMCMLAARAPASGALSFLGARAIRILPPYWFFSLFIVAIWLFKPSLHIEGLTGDRWQDWPRIAGSFFLVPQQSGPILGPGWTLVHEFIFYYYVSFVILIGCGRSLIYFLAAAAAISIILALADIKILSGYFLSPYYIEFFMGALIYHLYYRVSRLWAEYQILFAIGLYLGVSAYVNAHQEVPQVFLLQVTGFSVMGFLAISGTLGLYDKYRFAVHPLSKALCRVGDASYTLYLSHWFVLSVFGRLAGLLKSAPLPGVILWHAIAIVAAIAGAVIFAERVELPFHRWLAGYVKENGGPKRAVAAGADHSIP